MLSLNRALSLQIQILPMLSYASIFFWHISGLTDLGLFDSGGV